MDNVLQSHRMNSAELYDNYLNACYAADPSAALTALRTRVTSKQFERVRRKAVTNGVIAPTLTSAKRKIPRYIISPPERVHFTDAMVLSAAGDMLGLFLYDKKFNDGVYGAFGKKQNIRPAAHGHTIVIRLPCRIGSQCDRHADMLGKITSAMNHYISARPENMALIEYS